MAFQKLTRNQDPPHSFDMEPELEGVLVDKRENVGPNNSKLFVIEKKGGKRVTVWGSAVLNDLMQIPKGSTVKIKYLGKTKNPKTGREFRGYDIQFDSDTADIADVADQVFNG